MKNNGTDITKAYHNGIEITSIMFNGVDVGTFTPPAPPDYQPWENYPDSPVLTEDYPYQVVYTMYSDYLVASPEKLYRVSGAGWQGLNAVDLAEFKLYKFEGGVWKFVYNASATDYFDINEANADIYTDATLTTVHFAKTTS